MALNTHVGKYGWTIALVLLMALLARPAHASEAEAEAEAEVEAEVEAEAEAAEGVVERLHEALIDSMKAGERIDFEERGERLRPTVERTFHFESITRLVLGRNAREFDQEQLDTIADMLAQLSVRQYAWHFDRYNGESLVYLGSSVQAQDRVMVSTELVKADDERISLDYLLQKDDGRWGVVNVIADGVSDLALKRAEYAGTLKDEGYPGLIERLQEQIAETGPK